MLCTYPILNVFTGTNNLEICQHESELSELSELFGFVQEHLMEDMIFYACPHYQRYASIWERVNYAANDQRLPRAVKQYFTQAHHAAKDEAKRIFWQSKNKLMKF